MEHVKERLNRVLGLGDATAIGVGAVVGAGIFVVTGLAAKAAGPWALLAVVLAAIPAFLTALSYAELGAAIPKDGGSYEFAFNMISPFWGFVNGWFYLLDYLIVGAAVSVGFARYVAVFLPGVSIPLVAVLAIAGALVLNAQGLKQTTRLNDVLVLFKVGALLLLVALALGKVDGVHFAALTTLPAGADAWKGLLEGSALIFFAYLGFGRIATVAEEVENPGKNVPLAILGSLAICTILYVLVVFVGVGVVGASALASAKAPLSAVALAVGGRGLEAFLSIAALAATGSVLLTLVTGVSRVAFAMSQHAQLPRVVGKLSGNGSPVVAMTVFSVITALGAVFLPFEDLVGFAALGSLVFFCLTNVSAFLLETKHPHIPKPFKTPFHPLIPMLGLVSCVLLAAYIAPSAWQLGVVFFAVGLVVYSLHPSHRHVRSLVDA